MIAAFTQPGRTDFQSSLVTLAAWLRKSARPNIVMNDMSVASRPRATWTQVRRLIP
jgi:hypothetical protein